MVCVAGQVRAVEEVRRSMQVLVDEAGRERQEALELYSQESRKRKLIHNKLLELQGEGGSRQHRPDQAGLVLMLVLVGWCGAGNIRVLCRVRPVLPVEVQAGEDAVVTEFPSPEDIVVHKYGRTGHHQTTTTATLGHEAAATALARKHIPQHFSHRAAAGADVSLVTWQGPHVSRALRVRPRLLARLHTERRVRG